MTKRVKSISVLVVVLITAGWYLLSQKSHLQTLIQVQPQYLIPLFIVVLLQLSMNGLITKVCVACFNIDLEFKEWLGLAILTSMGNYLAPFRGGMVGKAIYLKKKYSFSYSDFAATVAASLLIIILEGCVLGLIAVILIYTSTGVFYLSIGLFMGITGLILLIILNKNYQNDQWLLKAGPDTRRAKLREALSGWVVLKKNKPVLMKISLLGLINYWLITMQMYFSALALSIDLSLSSAWFIAIFSGFTLLLSITPGNIGIQETVIGGIAEITRSGFNQGIILGALIRVVNVVIVFSIGPIFSFLLFRHLSQDSAN